ncbi:polyprenyl synthetase family protein [Weissella thailandensis]|uniref:Polyprenyl synthetase family protein n=3 Tax=Weissella thailandensis TaxID=89061 RepID=A0ABX9I4N5_9LACO|nr:polyprenyl synthetase family protein [Weissella thailandensis]RDS59497.1 polyprenyl synthetase family protein [Weissella thailandensis]
MLHNIVDLRNSKLMKQSLTQIHKMWERFPSVQKELQDVLFIIQDSLKANDKEVEKALLDMFRAGGKMLRPAFVIIIGQFYPGNASKLKHIAASIEMLHTATLVHDDIIDDSPERRHAPSIQSKFGKDIAAYAGDYLFAATFKTLAFHTDDMTVVRQSTKLLEDILTGELTQRTNHYDRHMTLADYKEQIAGKTAALFVLSAKLGATNGDAPEEFVNLVTDFAYNVGMAFQILDDILDYQSTTTDLGKPTLQDVREGVYSAPLIIAMQNKPEIQKLLAKKESITNEEAIQLRDMVIASGAVDEATDLASEYTEKALDYLSQLPEGESKDTLVAISEALLERAN